LKKSNSADATVLRRITEEVSAEIKSAVQFGLDARYPDPREVAMHVYA
jgi:TPP-dependent pyruvate/acetoin dehydrogenase alpha subunit